MSAEPSAEPNTGPRFRRGRMVAFLGLDGAGKSTLIEHALAELEGLGVPTTYRHMHPGLLPPLARLALKPATEGPVVDPHAKPPSGTLGSSVRLFYYWADYVLAYAFWILPSMWLARRAFVFDRYYYDYIVDPRRGRIALPEWVTRLLGRLVPAPDLIVVPTAAPEVLRARKPELPLEELQRQSARLDALADDLGAIRIDTSGALEDSLAATGRAMHALFPAASAEARDA